MKLSEFHSKAVDYAKTGDSPQGMMKYLFAT